MMRLVDDRLCRPPDGHAASCKSPNSRNEISLRPIHLAVFQALSASQEHSHVLFASCQLRCAAAIDTNTVDFSSQW